MVKIRYAQKCAANFYVDSGIHGILLKNKLLNREKTFLD